MIYSYLLVFIADNFPKNFNYKRFEFRWINIYIFGFPYDSKLFRWINPTVGRSFAVAQFSSLEHYIALYNDMLWTNQPFVEQIFINV